MKSLQTLNKQPLSRNKMLAKKLSLIDSYKSKDLFSSKNEGIRGSVGELKEEQANYSHLPKVKEMTSESFFTVKDRNAGGTVPYDGDNYGLQSK